MKFRTILLGCAALACATGASAQNTVKARAPVAVAPANTRLVTSVTEADLAALIQAEGHTVDATHPFEEPSMRGKTKDGLLFVLIGTACNKNGVAGCQGIMMQIRYDSNDTVTTDNLNASNLAEAALSAWWDRSDKTVGFTRYVVLDDGVTWMNIRQNLRVLLAIAPTAQGYVFK
ncbi:MAG TPA: hypothetical protein VHG29_11130 [Novosphingobium sp.]|nr:hypothetical protein [Novosphingobium sp.]